MLETYPALLHLTDAVPPSIFAGLQPSKFDWAVGQYLPYLESVIVDGALG